MTVHCGEGCAFAGCGKPLTGGIDTFGDVGENLCWDCYAQRNAEWYDTVYGLGPHHHDLSKTGSFIGSTVMEPLPEPDEDGRHIFPDGREFIPDPDAPGLGTWITSAPPGWR